MLSIATSPKGTEKKKSSMGKSWGLNKHRAVVRIMKKNKGL
jgi:hypothetical protein